MKTHSVLCVCVCMELKRMTMECMDRQALAGFVHSFNQSIRAISILLAVSKF